MTQAKSFSARVCGFSEHWAALSCVRFFQYMINLKIIWSGCFPGRICSVAIATEEIFPLTVSKIKDTVIFYLCLWNLKVLLEERFAVFTSTSLSSTIKGSGIVSIILRRNHVNLLAAGFWSVNIDQHRYCHHFIFQRLVWTDWISHTCGPLDLEPLCFLWPVSITSSISCSRLGTLMWTWYDWTVAPTSVD